MRGSIFICGHKGMVGSAIHRRLKNNAQNQILVAERKELDLLNQQSVFAFFRENNIEQVYLAAAKVGGIRANSQYPADFIYQNLAIQLNVIHGAFLAGIKRLLFLGSSCIYPKFANQPMVEDELLTGPLEPTNEPYAVAKIAGIKLCESYNRQYGMSHGLDFRSVMPTNLYGPGDSYHPLDSHVIPGLLARFHAAKAAGLTSVEVWGTGSARREFLFVDDLAEACVHIMELDEDRYKSSTKPMLGHLNVGYGGDISIAELAELVAKTVGYEGQILFDPSMPDGTPIKLLDSAAIKNLGWTPKIDLQTGLEIAYKDYLTNGRGNEV